MLRSVGLEPSKLTKRLKLHFIARLAPLVEPNFNFIELGPRSTGKSVFLHEFSPYSTLVSGGQATKATLFYNNARKRIGLVGFWDTVAFDEVAGIKIKDPDTIQIIKDFIANGRFSRGVEVIADASMAFIRISTTQSGNSSIQRNTTCSCPFPRSLIWQSWTVLPVSCPARKCEEQHRVPNGQLRIHHRLPG